MNFTVDTKEVRKVTVTITRKALWENFVECWKDVAWDEYSGVSTLKHVAEVLLTTPKLNIKLLRGLFADGGYTCLLMNDAMKYLDQRNIVREIIVVDVDDDNCIYVIPDSDIVF